MKTIEQVKKEIEFLLSRARGAGRTTRLAKLAKERNGILVVVGPKEAKALKRRFGIPVYSIDELDKLYGYGYDTPIFIDHFVYESLIYNLIHIVDGLRINLGVIKTSKER